jgi:hypothetical protein
MIGGLFDRFQGTMQPAENGTEPANCTLAGNCFGAINRTVEICGISTRRGCLYASAMATSPRHWAKKRTTPCPSRACESRILTDAPWSGGLYRHIREANKPCLFTPKARTTTKGQLGYLVNCHHNGPSLSV